MFVKTFRTEQFLTCIILQQPTKITNGKQNLGYKQFLNNFMRMRPFTWLHARSHQMCVGVKFRSDHNIDFFFVWIICRINQFVGSEDVKNLVTPQQVCRSFNGKLESSLNLRLLRSPGLSTERVQGQKSCQNHSNQMKLLLCKEVSLMAAFITNPPSFYGSNFIVSLKARSHYHLIHRSL